MWTGICNNGTWHMSFTKLVTLRQSLWLHTSCLSALLYILQYVLLYLISPHLQCHLIGISHNTQISSQFRLVLMILPFSLVNTKRNHRRSRFYFTSQFQLQILKWGWIVMLKMSASSLQPFWQCNYG